METNPTELLFFDLATYCVFGFFGCFFFMTWYLRRCVDQELQQRARSAVWLENIFYFRDYTRKISGRVHFVYYLALLFLAGVLGIFILNIFRQFSSMEPLYRYLLSGSVVLIVGLVLGLVHRLSQKRYYE